MGCCSAAAALTELQSAVVMHSPADFRLQVHDTPRLYTSNLDCAKHVAREHWQLLGAVSAIQAMPNDHADVQYGTGHSLVYLGWG